MAGADLELTLADGAGASVAGAAVESLAIGAGLPAGRASRLRVLVEGLIEEGRAREAVDGATGVTLRARRGAGDLHVEVGDRRLPLTVAEARRCRSRRLVALGFADRFHVGRHGADGNLAEIAVQIDDDDLTEGAGHDEVLDDTAARVGDDEAAALTVRPMEPADAEGLARCVYRCYGYTYLDPMMYRPRQIRRALQSGQMHSFVAVSAGGEVIGHAALTFDRPGDPVPEAGKLVVDPRYRGHHVAERIAEVRKQGAVDAGMVGYWVECVTNHPFSQREVIGTGGAETGLLIGASPAAITMAGLADGARGRHTLLAMFVPVSEGARAPLHVPPRHAALLGAIADTLGLPRDIITTGTGADAKQGTTRLHAEVSPATGGAHLRVDHVAADLVDRVADELEGLTAFDLAVVHLDLPLWQPRAAGAVEGLERLGFFWGAWVPSFAAEGDVLRLQRVGDHPVDIDHVCCARPEGEAVRDHVVSEWRRVTRGA